VNRHEVAVANLREWRRRSRRWLPAYDPVRRKPQWPLRRTIRAVRRITRTCLIRVCRSAAWPGAFLLFALLPGPAARAHSVAWSRLLATRLENRGIPRSATIMIGDRPDNDLEPARRAGWRTWQRDTRSGPGEDRGPWHLLLLRHGLNRA
jgi:hypothetical protein